MTVILRKFLERLAHDFPQYKHVVAATNPYDSKCVKDAYYEITNSQKQDRTARRTGSYKNNVGSKMAEARLVSIFCGSYDEQHMLRELKCNTTSHEVSSISEASLESSSFHSTNALHHEDSDSDYDDKRLIKRFKHGRNSPKPSFSSHTARDDNEHVPPLCLDDASSPESYSIETPNLSPMTTPLGVKETGAEIPDILDLDYSPGASKDPISTQPGYSIVSSELLVASWGSNMGKFCHPMPGGYECSCGHRTGTMGDMTRHWQSKRHSEAAFGCTACGKVYTREDALKRHMRRNDECARKARRIGTAS